jgi:excisionase family DNA binding protein
MMQNVPLKRTHIRHIMTTLGALHTLSRGHFMTQKLSYFRLKTRMIRFFSCVTRMASWSFNPIDVLQHLLGRKRFSPQWFRKEENMPKKSEGTEGRRYLSGSEAAKWAEVSTRTVQRWVDNGWLPAKRTKQPRRLLISPDDLEIFLATHPSQQSKTRDAKHAQEELVILKAQVQELLLLKIRVRRLEELTERLLAALAMSSTHQVTMGEEQLHPSLSPSDMRLFLDQLRLHLSTGQSGSILERRRLAAGSMSVAAFVKRHFVEPEHDKKVYEVKKLSREGLIQVTTIPRDEHATRNKLEWWLTPPQQHELVRYWQEHGMAYTECPGCPHTIPADAAE